MGRECRMVPPDWKHPKDDRTGHHKPLLDETFEDAMNRWKEYAERYDNGEEYDYFEKCWGPRHKESQGLTFAEWHGDPPDARYHRPEFTSEPTHFQMYETCSEGTPISPAFATAEECARWCADNGASSFADQTGSYEFWLGVIKGTAHGFLCIDGATGKQSVV